MAWAFLTFPEIHKISVVRHAFFYFQAILKCTGKEYFDVANATKSSFLIVNSHFIPKPMGPKSLTEPNMGNGCKI